MVLPLSFGLMGVLYAGPIADFIAFILSVVLVSRELKRQKMISQEKAAVDAPFLCYPKDE